MGTREVAAAILQFQGETLLVNELPPEDSRVEPRGREPVLVTSFEPCDKLRPKPASETWELVIQASLGWDCCYLQPKVSLTDMATLRVGEE